MRKDYYIEGNTVRELGQPVRREYKSREEIERKQREKSRRNAVRRNREKALVMNKGYVAFLSLCVMASAFASIILIRTQASVSSHMNNITVLESRTTDLKSDNDAKYKQLVTSVDLNEVKDIAINQLGMKYPTEDQVIYYSVEKNNFMDQYEDIPQ